MANFDLSNLAIAAACPGNEILYDDKGKPSIMVRIPKQTYAQLGMGASDAVHPAFIVNGQEVDAIWISKYHNITKDGRAYSLPGQDCRHSVTFDQAIAACAAKGPGWHLMTQMERGLLINWCENNGFIPKGNNNYGKHSSESNYKAIPAVKDGEGKTQRTLSGTGPLSWFHDNSPAGIDGLGGDVLDWSGGIRLVYGELQVLPNNNGADNLHPQTATSLEWKAIKAEDGSFIEPNGSGTTPGSIKMDFISNKLTYSTTITDPAPGTHYCNFGVIEADSTIGDDAKLLLKSLGLLPRSVDDLGKNYRVYFNNAEAERAFYCGGYFNNTASGFSTFYCNYARSHSYISVGFRSAFVEL